jgi:hypothetical protein
MMASIEGEHSNVEETSGGETHAGSLQDDVEDNADAERAEVWGRGIY